VIGGLKARVSLSDGTTVYETKKNGNYKINFEKCSSTVNTTNIELYEETN